MGRIATTRLLSTWGRGIPLSIFADASLDAAVDFLSVPHLDHQNEQNLILNLVDCAVVFSWPDVHSVELLFRLQSLRAVRMGVFLQAEEIPVDLLPDMRVEPAHVPLCRGIEIKTVSQESVSQFPNEVLDGNILPRFGQ